jgi:hypothetical protein
VPAPNWQACLPIAIDALDEGYDRETLVILRHQVAKLPGTFRVLVTSRPIDDTRTDPLNADHTQLQSVGIQGNTNQRDIASYINERLYLIAEPTARGLARRATHHGFTLHWDCLFKDIPNLEYHIPLHPSQFAYQ